MTHLPCMLALTLALSACGVNEAIFVTTTNIGINAETTPPNLSIAYNRSEGFIGPSDADGNMPPVVGRIASNLSVFSPKIDQVYATGDAALDATIPDGLTDAAKAAFAARQADVSKKQINEVGDQRRVAAFAVSSTTGLRLSFSPETIIDSVIFGYKRKEASYLPLINKDGKAKYPSTLGALSLAVSIDGQATPFTGVEQGMSQFFATGSAARNLAIQPQIRNLIVERAETSVEAASTGSIALALSRDQDFRTAANTWLEKNKTEQCPDLTEILFSNDCRELKEKFLGDISE